MTRRLRRHLRRRLRRLRRHRGGVAAVVAGAALAIAAHGVVASRPAASVPPPAHAAAVAIAYARAQIGKPYVWGGTGPYGYDCSGLVMEAYSAAGISLPRTSQEQFAAGTRVSDPEPGDLVFFAGSDGTVSAPGHVGLVAGPHLMIEAYSTGYPIRESSFGDSAAAEGDGSPVGYTRPSAVR